MPVTPESCSLASASIEWQGKISHFLESFCPQLREHKSPWYARTRIHSESSGSVDWCASGPGGKTPRSRRDHNNLNGFCRWWFIQTTGCVNFPLHVGSGAPRRPLEISERCTVIHCSLRYFNNLTQARVYGASELLSWSGERTALGSLDLNRTAVGDTIYYELNKLTSNITSCLQRMCCFDWGGGAPVGKKGLI